MRLRRSCIRVLRSPTRRSTSPWLRCWRTLLARPAGAGGSWDTGARWHRGLRGNCIIFFWVEGAGALWACIIVEGFSGLQQLEEPETWLQHHCEGTHEGFWGLRQLEEPETKLHHHWDGAHNGLAQALAHVPEGETLDRAVRLQAPAKGGQAAAGHLRRPVAVSQRHTLDADTVLCGPSVETSRSAEWSW